MRRFVLFITQSSVTQTAIQLADYHKTFHDLDEEIVTHVT
jgi:hypothetical protein